MRKYTSLLGVAGALALLSFSAFADTLSNWSGGIGNWGVASNWTPMTVPNNSGGAAYDATIGNTGTVTLDISPTVNTLTLNGTLTGPASGPATSLTVVNNATVNGALEFGAIGPGTGPASLSVGGNLNVNNSAYFVVKNNSVTVGGNLTNSSPEMAIVSQSGSDKFQVNGTLTNQGLLLLGNDRCFNGSCPPPVSSTLPAPFPGPMTSAGALVNNAQMFSWSAINTPSLVNNGLASFIGEAADAATLTNAGTIYLSNSCCSIAPEQTAALDVGAGGGASNYNQSSNGVLNEVLSGNSSYGVISAGSWLVPGNLHQGYTVNLDGTLNVMLGGGFIPSIGESFTIMNFLPGNLNGTFSNVTWDPFDGGQGYFTVSYDNSAGDVVLTAQASPEPGTFLLLGPGLALVCTWYTCRRKDSLDVRSDHV